MSSRSQTKLQTVKKALDHCDGSVKEATDLYTTLNDCAQKLDETVKEKKFEKEKGVGMELEERQILLSPSIIKILGETQKLKSLGVDSKKLEKAKEQYDGISHQLNSSPELHSLKEKQKKTIIEPQHINASHRKIAPDLSEVLELAWGRQVDFSQEAIKELFFMLETYLHVKEKSRSTSTGVVSSGDLHSSSTSTSQSLCLSTENIHIVLNQSPTKYKKDLIEKAVKELEQLETYVRKFSNREEKVFISQKQKREWYEQCLHATKDLLESAPCSKRPLCRLLQTARDDGTPNSNRALNEYCSLLRLEMLFNGMENPKGESQPRRDTATPIVHVPSVQMSMKDIIHSMEKYFPHDLLKEALEDFRKLQDIEEKIAYDENLRSRKVAWKERSRGGSKTYVDDKTPSRPLHAVLLRAQKEGINGSESALMEYGSMLHSEVLYESKDNFTQISAESLEVNETMNSQSKHKSVVNVGMESCSVPTINERKEEELRRKRERKVEAKSGSEEKPGVRAELGIDPKSGGDVKGMQGRAGSHYNKEQDYDLRRRDFDESKEFALQQEIDKLQDQLRIKNSEIEDLTTRLSQAASRSLMHNNPNIADLSDKNRPTKIGERFEQLFDNEWSDAHEILKSTISEREIYIILIEVVKDVYKFCKNALQQQILNIKEKLEKQIREPKFEEDKKEFVAAAPGEKDDMLSWMCEKSASEFQKGNAIHSVLGLSKIYKEYCKHRAFLRKELRSSKLEKIYPFIDATVELCWLMCAQTPPMQLVFAENKSTVNKSYFRCTGHTGNKVDVCAWPAVILHDGGPVVTRGHVLPS
ncbi:uncharacterized protein LOC128193003 isoform X2 [Crassostrea angulata]|uniref:uncharacterized protein LOC128193003 isoform X2 n=1 Tax=Magallana angulata TaxID=2784310 RepID=UPI0022B08A25|nr:uncharacterized protein LOC128193003 isoform X2 [Crassostrea angulata]